MKKRVIELIELLNELIEKKTAEGSPMFAMYSVASPNGSLSIAIHPYGVGMKMDMKTFFIHNAKKLLWHDVAEYVEAKEYIMKELGRPYTKENILELQIRIEHEREDGTHE